MQKPRLELFVFTLRKTTHGSLATDNVQAVKWDLPFEKPDLPQLFAYHFIQRGAGISSDTLLASVFQTIADRTVQFDPAAAPGSRWDGHPQNRTLRKKGYFGPYWVLLPVSNCIKHGYYYAQFHSWAIAIKHQVVPRDPARLLEAFSPYLIFNKETDDEIAGLSEAGTCPVREWNRSTFGRPAGNR